MTLSIPYINFNNKLWKPTKDQISPLSLKENISRKRMHTFRQIEQRIKKLYIDRVFAEIIVLKLLLYWYLILHSFPREGRVGWWKSSLLYFKWYQNIKLLTFSCWPFQPRSIIWEECKLFYFSQSFSLYFILLFNYTWVVIKTSRRFSTWNIFQSITKYFKIQNKQNIVQYQATFISNTTVWLWVNLAKLVRRAIPSCLVVTLSFSFIVIECCCQAGPGLSWEAATHGGRLELSETALGSVSFIVANYRNCPGQNNSTSKTIIILQQSGSMEVSDEIRTDFFSSYGHRYVALILTAETY